MTIRGFKFWLLLGLCPALAFAIPGDVRFLAEFTSNLTGTAPTAWESSNAFNLMNVDGYRIRVCAPSGQTLSGAGTLQIYTASTVDGAISRNPSIDETVSVTATSCTGAACRCQTFPDREQVAQQGGRLWAVPSGVTVSGGTTVTVLIEGFRKVR
jgi:hypothetical protein